jgi:hypothetical protein
MTGAIPPAVRRLDTIHIATDADSFADVFPAAEPICIRLWDLLENIEAVVLEVSGRVFNACCGADVSSTIQTYAVVVTVERERSRGESHELLVSGAAAHDVHDLLKRRDRARERLEAVEAGERDDDPEALRTAAEALDRRAHALDDLTSSFEGVWIPAGRVEAAYCEGESSDGPRRYNGAKVGV